MLRTLLIASSLVSISLLGCGADDGSGEGSAGALGEPCIAGVYCNGDLVCAAEVCTEPNASTGDGDGDTNSGETSDGEPGDGDGDPGDGDGDPGDGDGDTGGGLGLYEGPCLSSDECDGDLWCAYQNGRYWCAADCTDDLSCPSHAGASALPTCEFSTPNDGRSPRQGCVLACEAEAECPDGAQCFGSGIGSKSWCGFLPT